MIWELRYWKADLLRFADQLGRARTTASPSPSKTYVSVEKAVLTGLGFASQDACVGEGVLALLRHAKRKPGSFRSLGRTGDREVARSIAA